MNDRSDFFETVYPAESSGLNVHRLRALLNSPSFVSDLADTPSDVRAPVLSSDTEAGVIGPQIDVQPLSDLSDALSEITLLESWWGEVHCEARHLGSNGTPFGDCTHRAIGVGWSAHLRPERFPVCTGWVSEAEKRAWLPCPICEGDRHICNWFELD